MDIDSLLKIKELISPEDEETQIVSNPNKGSVFNPGDIGGGIITLNYIILHYII